MKKILALLLCLAMVACLFAGCATTKKPEATTAPSEATTAPSESTDAPTTTPTESSPDYSGWHVAMITDYGDITDQSFNQTTYEAGQSWCAERGIDFTYYKPVADSTADRVAMVDQAVADGYNVMLMPGYAFAGTLVEIAPSYPDVKFIALDVSLSDLLAEAVGSGYDYNPDNWNLSDYVDLSNVYCAVYEEQIPGYMAGYAAVKLGYTHLGYLGGMAVPAVIRYGYGFVQGCNAAAEELGIADKVVIDYVYGNQFYGDIDITAYMDTLYGKGLECCFAAGGSIYSSACEVAAKVDGKVIGVDVDQAAGIDSLYGEGMTVTSAMKGLAETVFSVLTDLIENDNWADYGGKVATLGLVSADPAENYVGIAPSTQYEDGKFTEEDYLALVAALYNGEITVSSDTMNAPETAITVNYLGNIK